MLRAVGAVLAVVMLACCSTRLPLASVFGTPEPVGGLDTVDFVSGPGGIRAWLIEEHSIPIIAMRMAWYGGDSSDPDGLEGTVDFLAYMMNEGARDRDSDAFARRMEELNMSFGCSSSADWLSCSMATLSANRHEAFALVADAINAARFDREPLARAVREKLVELTQAQTLPGWIAARTMNAALRPAHPYSRYPTADSVRKIERNHLVSSRDAIMARDNLLISVVGDISAGELKTVMDEMFGDLPPVSAAAAIPPVRLNSPPGQPISRYLPRPQTLIWFSAPGPKRNDPDFMVAYVLNHIFGGGGFSSRLMGEIREKRGLTYGIATSLSTLLHGGMWTGRTQTRNDAVDEVMSLIGSEIARLHRDGPTEKERQDAIAYLTGAYPLGFDSNAGIARQMMYAQQYALGADYFVRRNDLVRAVTLEDLKRVARIWLDPGAFTFVLVGGGEKQHQNEHEVTP